MKTITVTVDPEGGVVIETKGFKGRLCEKATAMLEAALGKVRSEKKTPEFYLPADQKETQR